MYGGMLILHSYLRWAVLLLVAAAAVVSMIAWRRGATSGVASKKLGLVAMIAVDLQLLVGLLLYFVFSPLTRRAMSDVAAAMQSRPSRFWLVEHITIMVLAVVLVHVGRLLARRASTTVRAHKRIAIFFALALLLLLVATPWPFQQLIGRPLLRF